MRIVAGSARGRRLLAPPGSVTRPTADRVREAVFSTVHSRLGPLEGAGVLDLFAGSGALGLEALSRGASTAVFVESHRSVARTLRDNIERVGLPGAHVVIADARAFAARAPERSGIDPVPGPVDLVLCDPPYAYPAHQVGELLAQLTRSGWLAEGCLVAVERDARDEASPWPVAIDDHGVPDQVPTPRVTGIDRRAYGDTALWYGRLVERAP